MLSVGGTVTLNDENKEIAAAGLPREPIRLVAVDLHGIEQVSDAGLARLAGLDKLTEWNVTGTKVTAMGVGGLGKALPKCKITWDGGVSGPK